MFVQLSVSLDMGKHILECPMSPFALETENPSIQCIERICKSMKSHKKYQQFAYHVAIKAHLYA